MSLDIFLDALRISVLFSGCVLVFYSFREILRELIRRASKKSGSYSALIVPVLMFLAGAVSVRISMVAILD